MCGVVDKLKNKSDCSLQLKYLVLMVLDIQLFVNLSSGHKYEVAVESCFCLGMVAKRILNWQYRLTLDVVSSISWL